AILAATPTLSRRAPPDRRARQRAPVSAEIRSSWERDESRRRARSHAGRGREVPESAQARWRAAVDQSLAIQASALRRGSNLERPSAPDRAPESGQAAGSGRVAESDGPPKLPWERSLPPATESPG